jgi:hypothetical protein
MEVKRYIETLYDGLVEEEKADGCEGGGPYVLAEDFDAVTAERDRLREALTHLVPWVQAALDCKSWRWDGDQRSAAEECLEDARAALSGEAK